MATQTMSVTQALAELKLLDKRIRKVYVSSEEYYGDTNSLGWMAVRTKSSPVDTEALKKTASAEWQSFMDLVNRRDRLKKAIVLSNAETRVKIGEWEGSVAEAIEHKSSIKYKKDMLEKAKEHVKQTEVLLARKQAELQERLDKLLQSELGKDVRTNPDTIQAISVSFLENNKVELVDPIGLKEKVRVLEAEVEEFESNVDWVLSEANGRAMIRV